MSKKIKVAIVGLGSRGKDTYAPTAKMFSNKMEIVAIADIIPEKVAEVAKKYNLPESACYTSAEEMLEQDKLADIMFICTQDRQHVPHAIPALKKGYHLLLEKPISPELDECREITKVAKECNRKVVVCHVLRYTPFYSKLKEVIDSGIIGDVVNVTAMENVGYWHQAHSFVRGNWCNSEQSSPMILQKCCHDMDLYLWLTGKTCESVTSFGNTYLFKAECAPEGSTERCMDGCKVKEDCPFDAEKIYITNKITGIRSAIERKLSPEIMWPSNVLAQNPTEEKVMEAIKTGPYGRCVYRCNNNVVDHQVVNLRMTDGSTLSFTMTGFTEMNYRHAKIMGTKGEIVADMHKNTLVVTPFGKDKETIDISKIATDFSGHGGGDVRMVEEFIDMLLNDTEMPKSMTALEVSAESHYIALAAEESRLNDGKVISLETMRK